MAPLPADCSSYSSPPFGGYSFGPRLLLRCRFFASRGQSSYTASSGLRRGRWAPNGGFTWICHARCIFFTDGCLDRYRTNSLFSRDPLTSIGPRMGPTMWALKGLRKSLTTLTPIDLLPTARFSTIARLNQWMAFRRDLRFGHRRPSRLRDGARLEKMSISCSTVLSSQKMG